MTSWVVVGSVKRRKGAPQPSFATGKRLKSLKILNNVCEKAVKTHGVSGRNPDPLQVFLCGKPVLVNGSPE